MISVIVPIYNPPFDYYKECLNSITSQTLDQSEYEVILIFNGCDDEYIKYYEKLNTNFKSIILADNVNYSGAVNKGISLSKGGFIYVLDSDDILDSDALFKITSYLKEYNDTEILIFQSKVFNCHTKEILFDPYYQFSTIAHVPNPFTFKSAQTELLYGPTVLWNKVFSKEFLIKNNITLDSELGNVCVDSLFSIKCYINANNIRFLKESLHTYRTNVSSSIVSSLRKKEFIQAPFIYAEKLILFFTSKKEFHSYIPSMVDYNLSQLKFFFSKQESYKNRFAYLILLQRFLSEYKSILLFKHIKDKSTFKWYKYKRFLLLVLYYSKQCLRKVQHENN